MSNKIGQKIINETVMMQAEIITHQRKEIKELARRVSAQDTRIEQLTNLVKGWYEQHNNH